MQMRALSLTVYGRRRCDTNADELISPKAGKDERRKKPPEEVWILAVVRGGFEWRMSMHIARAMEWPGETR